MSRGACTTRLNPGACRWRVVTLLAHFGLYRPMSTRDCNLNQSSYILPHHIDHELSSDECHCCSSSAVPILDVVLTCTVIHQCIGNWENIDLKYNLPSHLADKKQSKRTPSKFYTAPDGFWVPNQRIDCSFEKGLHFCWVSAG
jgi:hypothetical protein